ncbi:GntR family transcriptional regulator [Actinotalea sp.]|uniref:GntR family transcriptional regulator n=1 Tax=Actinotalea sp. TaxID=1872145 RepID=UPI002BBA1501|nr:GntR family transcriptional regulator [Actinotalea sp.]HQY32709.1 GntR family transcriptional regulator [Actinotalea sp.]HRA50772.1 GntR family transcriptional regulator [Actinotalea sp.]
MTHPLRIDLDRGSSVPLYHQVAQSIEAAIADGRLPPGDLLESEVAMAARLGISRPTARQALRELVDRGRLVRRRGAGTHVAPARIRRPVDLTSLYDDLASSGRLPTTVVLDHADVPATPDVADALDLTDGTEVLRLRRLRLSGGEPLAVMTNYLPLALAPSREELEVRGLYDCLRARGVRPRVARQRIGARNARAAEARMLEEPARAALLTMERTAFDEAGTAVEFGQHIYRASRYSFETTLFAH